MALFAISNFLGPLLLGRYFDTVGRIPMISGTYLGSAAIVAVLGVLVMTDSLSTWSFMALIIAAFFLASAGASSAYLTVSEIFPMETRALAIALFFAVGTATGGIVGPTLFGRFIHSGDTNLVGLGFLIGAGAMALGGIAELFLGVRAEQQSLESIATPLTAEDADAQERMRNRADRRERHDRAGLRRLRPGPGPGSSFYSPGMSGTAGAPSHYAVASEKNLDREVGAIARALDEHGPMSRRELAELVEAPRWGPGRFRIAIRVATAEGGAARTARGGYGPPVNPGAPAPS
jgi:MFS family permease